MPTRNQPFSNRPSLRPLSLTSIQGWIVRCCRQPSFKWRASNDGLVPAVAYQCRPLSDAQRSTFAPQVRTDRYSGGYRPKSAIYLVADERRVLMEAADFARRRGLQQAAQSSNVKSRCVDSRIPASDSRMAAPFRKPQPRHRPLSRTPSAVLGERHRLPYLHDATDYVSARWFALSGETGLGGM